MAGGLLKLGWVETISSAPGSLDPGSRYGWAAIRGIDEEALRMDECTSVYGPSATRRQDWPGLT